MHVPALALALLACAPAAAQTLVKNIAGPGPENPSRPNATVTMGGQTFFSAYGNAFGRELWKTDGTAAGTVVLDLYPGTASSQPDHLTEMGGTLFFTVGAGSGTGLWKSDGTVAGSVEVLPPGRAQFITSLRAAGNLLFFIANTPSAGWEIWRSDGTEAGTFMVEDVLPGTASSVVGAFSPSPVGVAGGRLYFAAIGPGTGREVWVSDGTEAGTYLVADLEPGALGSMPDQFTELGGQVLFVAETLARGRELYRTDGSEAGTQIVLDLQPGSASGAPNALTAWQGLAYFGGTGPAGIAELWRSDGTAAGTQQVAPGSGTTPRELAPAGTLLYYTALDPVRGRELWRTDGTPAGTAAVADLEPGSLAGNVFEAVAFGSALVFVGSDPASSGRALWRSDGTPGGTQVLRGFPFADDLVRLGGEVVLSADDGMLGEELWKSDGTAAGTVLLANLATPTEEESLPHELTRSGGLVFFKAAPSAFLEQLWVTDGTEAGTRLASTAPFVGGSHPLADFMGSVYGGSNAGTPYEDPFYFWRVDSTTFAATLLMTGYSSQFQPINDMTPFGRHLLFSARPTTTFVEMWRTDGTLGGTVQITNIGGAGASFGAPLVRDFAVAGSLCFFSAETAAARRELWATDGTVGGEYLVRDIDPTGSSDPGKGVALGDRLLFAASAPGLGRELWVSDGTEAGTVLLRDIRPGSASSLPQQLTVMGNRLFFTADDGANGLELWRTDGTTAGTVLVADVLPGPAGSNPRHLTAAADRLFFSAVHPKAGREPFVSDGTAAGTLLLRDIHPAGDSDPTAITALSASRHVIFAATEPSTGSEAWISDGTPAGTVPAGEVEPGPGSSSPDAFTQLGARVLCAATQTAVGRELFAFDLVQLGVGAVESYGAGCSGTGGLTPALSAEGTPSLGAPSFALRVDDARPLAAAGLLLSAQRVQIALGECALLVAPGVVVPIGVGAEGSARIPLPIPNLPGLLGVELDLQALVADPAGGLLGVVSATQGLALLVGS